MARTTERLTALQVTRLASRPGFHADGGGLYLKVTDGGASWVFRFMVNGRRRYMGLGPLKVFGLQEARAKALDAQRQRHAGIDPVGARLKERASARLEAAKAITFKACAEAYIKAHRAGWRNSKHATQWEATLKTYAEPIIGSLPVQTIDTALVMKVLEQEVRACSDKATLWTVRPETASRVRGRIEAILDWARVRGYRDGENPARWRGHLDKLLPARNKIRKVEHYAALPYKEMPEFMRALQAQEGTAARALAFTILTVARTNEVIGAWSREIDLAMKAWVVPSERMKAGNEHRVPLSPQAMSILENVAQQRDIRSGHAADSSPVFPGNKLGVPLSNMAMTMVLRRMGRNDITVHGFRSTFRDWAAERTNFPREVIEMALAHTVGDKVEAAYRRGDLLSGGASSWPLGPRSVCRRRMELDLMGWTAAASPAGIL